MKKIFILCFVLLSSYSLDKENIIDVLAPTGYVLSVYLFSCLLNKLNDIHSMKKNRGRQEKLEIEKEMKNLDISDVKCFSSSSQHVQEKRLIKHVPLDNERFKPVSEKSYDDFIAFKSDIQNKAESFEKVI